MIISGRKLLFTALLAFAASVSVPIMATSANDDKTTDNQARNNSMQAKIEEAAQKPYPKLSEMPSQRPSYYTPDQVKAFEEELIAMGSDLSSNLQTSLEDGWDYRNQKITLNEGYSYLSLTLDEAVAKLNQRIVEDRRFINKRYKKFRPQLGGLPPKSER